MGEWAMFHRWHKRVLREGAQTEGQVYGLTGYGGAEGGPTDFGVKVRVRFPDGSTTEFEKGPLEARHVGLLFEGSVVPVRYDPADTSKAVLDVPALEAAHSGVAADRKAQLDAQFERMGEGGTAAGGDLMSQIMQMASQGQGGVIDLREPNATPEDRVAKLEMLKQSGLLNDEQFEAAKAKILGEGG
jgi:hypothetical protein